MNCPTEQIHKVQKKIRGGVQKRGVGVFIVMPIISLQKSRPDVLRLAFVDFVRSFQRRHIDEKCDFEE